VFSSLFSVRAIVIVLGNSDRGSESPEHATSGIRASRFVGISEVDHFQSRISFGGKVSTFIYLDLFSLISFCSCVWFSRDMSEVNQSTVRSLLFTNQT